MKVILIPFDDEKPCTVHDIEDALDSTDEESYIVLKRIKNLIDIDMAEIVYLNTLHSSDPDRDFCLIVDEVGKLKEGWPDRINIRASQFYPGTLCGDPIVGDVVLCPRQWTPGHGECDLAGFND